MNKLLDDAKKFADENPANNEIELTDSAGNKVRLVRCTPTPIVYNYPWQWQVPAQPY